MTKHDRETFNEMLEILKTLDEWYSNSNGIGPYASSLLFEDDRTFGDHVKAAIVAAEPEPHPVLQGEEHEEHNFNR